MTRNKDIEGYLRMPQDMPKGKDTSVRFGSDYRFDEARIQAENIACFDERKVAEDGNFVLKQMGLKPVENPFFTDYKIDKNQMCKVDYAKLKEENDLANEADLVWIKLAKKPGAKEPCAVGVVACSNDLNMNMIPDGADVREKCSDGSWAYNTSGILVKSVGMVFEDEYMMVWPLSGLAETPYSRHDVEHALGEYLVANGTPVIDRFSHCF